MPIPAKTVFIISVITIDVLIHVNICITLVGDSYFDDVVYICYMCIYMMIVINKGLKKKKIHVCVYYFILFSVYRRQCLIQMDLVVCISSILWLA